MTTALETLYKFLEPITAQRQEWYNARKEEAGTVMSILSPLLRELAETQMGGDLPPEISKVLNSVTDVPSSLLYLWPKQVLALDGDTKEEFIELLTKVMEVGCALHLTANVQPHRPLPSDVTDTSALRVKWLTWAHKFEWSVHKEKNLREIYLGIDKPLVESILDEEVIPFFKAHGLAGGFLGSRTSRLSRHARNLFYAGMFLGLVYDAQGELE